MDHRGRAQFLRQLSGNVRGKYEHGQAGLTELAIIEVPDSTSSKPTLRDNVNHVEEQLITHSSDWNPDNNGGASWSLCSVINQTLLKRLQGWRFGVALAAWTTITVLLINIIFTIVVVAKYGQSGGIGTLFNGSCEAMNTKSTWLHLLINVLSSLLLSASNFTMQCLCSPTRTEINRSHARGSWMDIGVPSLRNLSQIRWPRTILWGLLAISSIPIHLLYNSAVFRTLDSNMYSVIVAPESFLETELSTSDFAKFENQGNLMYGTNLTNPQVLTIQNQITSHTSSSGGDGYQKLSNLECIEAYGIQFVSSRNNVVLVTSSTTKTAYNDTVVTAFLPESDVLPYTWICANQSPIYADECDLGLAKRRASEWSFPGSHGNMHRVEYCLSQTTQSHCKLQFSLGILIAVIVCNALKAISMLWTLHKLKDPTLVTVGDAIASFLKDPDSLTSGLCMSGRVNFQRSLRNPLLRLGPVKFDPKRRPLWFTAASKRRWWFTLSLIVGALITGVAFLSVGLVTIRASSSSTMSPFSLGFGTVDNRAIVSTSLPSVGNRGLMAAVLVSNCPQAISSFLFLLYDGLMTSLLLAKEWSMFAVHRRPLRVTDPTGQQRSSHFLHLPFLYSIPLVAISAVLHWAISQGLFLARIDIYDNGVYLPDSSVSSLGYSPSGIVLVISIGVALLLGVLAMGFRRFDGSMPIASSCSWAISAACHPPKEDVHAAYLLVQWGEPAEDEHVYRGIEGDGGGGDDVDEDFVGHCCFTSLPVHPPVPGRKYAGINYKHEQKNNGLDKAHQS